ncbi:unnamed protein product, partial [Amoebophrya sp. A25]
WRFLLLGIPNARHSQDQGRGVLDPPFFPTERTRATSTTMQSCHPFNVRGQL